MKTTGLKKFDNHKNVVFILMFNLTFSVEFSSVAVVGIKESSVGRIQMTPLRTTYSRLKSCGAAISFFLLLIRELSLVLIFKAIQCNLLKLGVFDIILISHIDKGILCHF